MSWQRIGIFRALQLGDMLCMVPALRALRAACPQAEITLIGLPWASELARRFTDYIDDFVAFPGLRGFPEQPEDEQALPGFLADMNARRFDLLLQFHGNGRLSNPLAATIGARRVAGFCPPGDASSDSSSFIEWDEGRNEVLRFLDVLQLLGVPARGTQLEFPLLQSDVDELRHAAPTLSGPGDYICIHPGARYASRRWPKERFAEVGMRAVEAGWQVVLTGSAQEVGLTREIAHHIKDRLRASTPGKDRPRASTPGRGKEGARSPVLDLAGLTTLGSLAALVAGARLVVCNDTGLSHVAAAVAAPSVVISSGADTRRWSPLDAGRHRVLWAQTLCRPCMHVDCPHVGHPCAQAVGAGQVWAAAHEVLGASTRAHSAMDC